MLKSESPRLAKTSGRATNRIYRIGLVVVVLLVLVSGSEFGDPEDEEEDEDD